jgi:hypothetical protein
MRNISDRGFIENQNTDFIFNIPPPQKNRAIYVIMPKNIVERSRPQMTIWRMRIRCWIPKATYTPSEYVILIAFPLQQWLHERAAMLFYTHIAVLFIRQT